MSNSCASFTQRAASPSTFRRISSGAGDATSKAMPDNRSRTSGMRLLLFTGVMGGFTTFSSFGLETFYLLKRGDYMIASGNIVFSVLFGMAALFIGFNTIAERSQAIS